MARVVEHLSVAELAARYGVGIYPNESGAWSAPCSWSSRTSGPCRSATYMPLETMSPIGDAAAVKLPAAAPELGRSKNCRENASFKRHNYGYVSAHRAKPRHDMNGKSYFKLRYYQTEPSLRCSGSLPRSPRCLPLNYPAEPLQPGVAQLQRTQMLDRLL